MKRILAFVIVLSVLLSVSSISAAAAPVYSVAADIQSFAVSPMSLDSGVSTLATGDSIIIDSANTLYWQQYSSQLGNLIVNYFYGGGFSPGSLLYNIYQISQAVSTSLSSIDLSTDAIRTDVSSILSDMGAITTAIQTVITAIETNSNFLSTYFLAKSPESYLNYQGVQTTLTTNFPFVSLVRHGFLGMRSLISGSETDNIYSLTLWDNNNESSTVNATGLGPMLRVALGNVGENLAKLAFMFAADDDVQLKADSQPVLDEVTDTVFGSGSGKVKLDVSNVSDLTGMSDDVLGYFETGGQIGDINTVVNNDSTWLWFTSQTAADLDTTGSSLSRAAVELEPEIDSHTKWYASFYRDVLGRDYVGG